jgi:predicted AAA+ superfamily ATPase
LFELGCIFSGQVLSFNKILGQLHDAGNTTTLSHYLNLLENVGLLAGLEKFSKGVIMQRSSSPKFQVQNTALFSALSNYTFPDALTNNEIWGRHVESAVGAHLLNATKTGDVKLTYWRDGNFEVDYVLEYKDKIIGLEVKTGNSKFTSGMNRFKSQYNPHKMYLIAENGLNWKEFLKINPVDLF